MSDTQRTMGALNSPVRREILWRVWDQELPVGEIVQAFELTPPTISGHLAVLRDAGLVSVRVEGTRRWYRADQEAVRRARDLVPGDPMRWRSNGDHPEQAPALAATSLALVLIADAACSQAGAFRAFTNADLYSRWLGAPVNLNEGHFSATMDWGLRVRGSYTYVQAPSLIVMSWDFDHQIIPAPGDALRATLLITPHNDGCRLELCQLAPTQQAASYMERAWRFVLGRFTTGVIDALQS